MEHIFKLKAHLLSGVQVEFEVESTPDATDEQLVAQGTHAFFTALRDGRIGVAGLRAGRVLGPVTLERVEVLR